jgi:hypothetical protein
MKNKKQFEPKPILEQWKKLEGLTVTITWSNTKQLPSKVTLNYVNISGEEITFTGKSSKTTVCYLTIKEIK